MSNHATETEAPVHPRWGGARPGAGRPNGSYTTWLPEEEAAKKWGTLIQRPPRCVCGERDYRYKWEGGLIYARCNNCDEKILFDARAGKWWKDRASMS